MQIGIIETGKAPAALTPIYGSYPVMGAALLNAHLDGFEWQPISLLDGMPLPTPETFDGYLIMGSEFSANDPFPWIAELCDFVRKLAAAKIPLVGICFGHQLIAKAMGGEVTHRGWVIGSQHYVSTKTADSLRTLSFHQDQVTKLPESVTCTLTNSDCQYAALRYEGWPCWTIQSHPEFSIAYMQALIERTRGRPLTNPEADRALASLAKQTATTAPTKDLIASALRQVLKPPEKN
ncbi:MAG: type 1 glutamine amidotransferase [Pseudomonadota bacterium]